MRDYRLFGRHFVKFSSPLVASLMCLASLQGHAVGPTCEEKAESLGWAVGCGCIKHDITKVQDNSLHLLPECAVMDTQKLKSSITDGLEESINHDEYNFLCMLSCGSADWSIVNQLIRRGAGEGA